MEDIDYQSSVDTLAAYWKIPSSLQAVAPDMHISIEEHSALNSLLTFLIIVFMFG